MWTFPFFKLEKHLLTEVSCILLLYPFLASFMVSLNSFISSFSQTWRSYIWTLKFFSLLNLQKSGRITLEKKTRKIQALYKYRLWIYFHLVLVSSELVAMYFVFHLGNNKEVKIYDEVLWSKTEGLISDVAGFLRLTLIQIIGAIFLQ